MHSHGPYGKVPDSAYVCVLGSVGLRDPDGVVHSPPPTSRALLAALGLATGDVVPAERLRDTVWPAGDARRGGLQTAVHRLRQWLAQRAPAGLDVVTSGSGYQLTGDTDLARFRQLMQRAGPAGSVGAAGSVSSVESADAVEPADGRPRAARLMSALEVLSQALALWRGEPLANVPAGRRDEEAVRALQREHLGVARRAGAAAVRAGDAGRAVGWLLPLAAAHPFDEPTQAAAIEALAAAGRHRDAMDRYESTRALLAERLGMDPGDGLRAAYQRLRQAVSVPPSASGPCTLPADLADFTGRSAELAAVRRALHDSGLVIICGWPGSGSTALAVHAAHELRRTYPAGQLFGTGADALAQFERQWGGPLPREPELLLVADDVPDVAALLRGRPPGAALIVTTRDARPVDGTQVRLTGLSPDESRELLTQIAARPWDSEVAALEQVVRACLGSPAVLRWAGALLARRPHWTVDDLATYLATHPDQLAGPFIESDR